MPQFAVNSGAARIAARFGAVKFACHKLPVPAHDGVGFHDIGHFLNGLKTEAMSNFCQCSPFGVGEP
jgi:hypothetical protein